MTESESGERNKGEGKAESDGFPTSLFLLFLVFFFLYSFFFPFQPGSRLINKMLAFG
jgi:hypothetical protein